MLVLLAAPAADLPARPLQLEEARQLERAGDSAAAARLYLAWARDRVGRPSALAGFAGFVRCEDSLDALVDGCREIVASVAKVPGAWPLLARSAELFELAGLHEEAAEAAVAAWNRGGPASLLVRAMRLDLAMGDLEAYQAAAHRAITVDELDPLAATADRLAGDIDKARAASARILAAATGGQSARLAAAWNLFETSRSAGSAADRALAAKRLAQEFPGSPEAVIAAAAISTTTSRVREAASPAQFIMLTQPERPSAASAGTPPAGTPPAGGTYAVQAGAFQVRENADELLKDLVRSGFAASTSESSVNGKTVYRVFAAARLDRQSADGVLQRLRASGFAGFVVGE